MFAAFGGFSEMCFWFPSGWRDEQASLVGGGGLLVCGRSQMLWGGLWLAAQTASTLPRKHNRQVEAKSTVFVMPPARAIRRPPPSEAPPPWWSASMPS